MLSTISRIALAGLIISKATPPFKIHTYLKIPPLNASRAWAFFSLHESRLVSNALLRLCWYPVQTTTIYQYICKMELEFRDFTIYSINMISISKLYYFILFQIPKFQIYNNRNNIIVILFSFIKLRPYWSHFTGFKPPTGGFNLHRLKTILF